MQYAGFGIKADSRWAGKIYNTETKESSFKGPFCTIDLTKDCAKKLKKQYSAIKIYHLVYEEFNQL